MNLNGNPARFKTPGHILNEPRLLMVSDPQPWHPSEECEKLAAVAHTQRKCIGTIIKIVKHLPQPFIESDRCSPPFGAFRNIGVRKPSYCNESSEALQVDSSADQVGHRDIPWAESRLIEGRCHLTIAVTSLFPENCNFGFVFSFKNMCRRRFGLERNDIAGTFAIEDISSLLIGTLGIHLKALDLIGRFFPPLAKNTHVGLKNLLRIIGHKNLLFLCRLSDYESIVDEKNQESRRPSGRHSNDTR